MVDNLLTLTGVEKLMKQVADGHVPTEKDKEEVKHYLRLKFRTVQRRKEELDRVEDQYIHACRIAKEMGIEWKEI